MNDYHRNFGFPSGKKPEGRREWIEYIIGALVVVAFFAVMVYLAVR